MALSLNPSDMVPCRNYFSIRCSYKPWLLFVGPQRLPFPTGYKRPREYEDDDDDDDEYDSEMDDFIEDEGEPQEEISKHIREIFGYDRKK